MLIREITSKIRGSVIAMCMQQHHLAPCVVLFTLVLIELIAAPASADNILDIFQGSSQVNDKIFAEPKDSGYDFVVVGAGSGGSAVANRLSENPAWRVLLLEAGSAEGILSQIPVLVSFFQLTEFNYGYKVEPQKNCCLGMKNRQCPWPRGKCLGGTSAINYMIHTRGNRIDYDTWERLGNRGWAYKDVLHYFKKSEKFMVPGEYYNMTIWLRNANLKSAWSRSAYNTIHAPSKHCYLFVL